MESASLHSRKNCRKCGFTVIELLVVVGIVGVLVGLLIPTLNHIHESSRRAQELSDLKQLAAACIIYAHDNDEMLPIGKTVASGGGVPASTPPAWGSNSKGPSGSSPDDFTWINYRDCWTQLLSVAPQLQQINSCRSVLNGYPDADDFGSPGAEYGYPNDTRLGWIYWGGRDDLVVNGQIAYRALHRLGQHPTPGSQTLWTCWCWDSNGQGGPSTCPHVGTRFVAYPNGVQLRPPPDGLCIALDDGSASFVPWKDMIIIPQANGWKLYYQP